MKQLLVSIVILVCIVTSCSKQHTPQFINSSRISIIDDITDPFAVSPIADPILGLYDFEHNQDMEATFRLVLITDKKLNPVEEIHIADGKVSETDNVNDEIDFRENLIYSFYDASMNAITEFHKKYEPIQSLKNSECFATISNELVILANYKTSKRILIVFSDLQENTDVFSCYTSLGQQMLIKHPESVANLLQDMCPLPENLKGIIVYFVFQPKDRESDIAYEKIVNIYKQLLIERGAQVIIQATNKYYQL